MNGKDYTYRVSDASGNYIGIWRDVVSEFQWSQPLNTPGTTTTVRLARSASNTVIQPDSLIVNTGDALTDSTGDPYYTLVTSSNTVGAGSDCEMNYHVDVYVTYGFFDEFVSQTGEQYVNDAGIDYILADGSPLGRRIFSGVIMDYEATWGDSDYVDVTVASFGFELSQELVRSGTTTTVNFTTQAPETIIKNVLDTNPQTMSYSAASIGSSGVTISPAFQLNTKLEGIQQVFDQTDAGWWWFGNPADNLVYFNKQNTVADHTFVFKKHLNSITVKRSMENLKNDIYFVGGDGGSGILYKQFTDSTAISTWRQGLDRISDTRYTASASASRYATKQMSRFKNPIYSSTVNILDVVYDIDSIQLGQMVGFQNFGNFVDGLLLQIVQIDYTPHVITLTLGDLLDRLSDTLYDVQDSLQNTQFSDIPSAPS